MRKNIFLICFVFPFMLSGQKYIADYEIAKENVLRSVPVEYIYKARNEFHIAYQHTSHGTHVSRGVFGLQDYKAGDDTLFAITNNAPADGKLDFRDYALQDYHAPGDDASDLSRNETAFIRATRNYLDDTANAEINIIMWSWCDIYNHHVDENYLPGMDSLINEYGQGGTKTGTGPGQRVNPVRFIFMTGHANTGSNVGLRRPKDQADTINKFCNSHHQFCIDYYSIDSHDMNDNYREDAGDNGNSSSYGGNFYEDWQSAHTLGMHYYENKTTPGGTADYGEHNTQHITANRKAMAFWWILARMAGWDGVTTNYVPPVYVEEINIVAEDNAETITADNGTLQMHADVSPDNAGDTTVTWSVSNTGIATVSNTGLLTANSNGTVIVRATANDGSGVIGTDTIVISGQDSEPDPGTQPTVIFNNRGNNLKIFPVPCNNILNVSGIYENDLAEGIPVRIYGTDGKLYISEHIYSDHINVSALDKGIYIISVSTPKYNIQQLLVRE